MALNIGLDYIIKVLLDEDLPESIPDTGIQNLTELIVESFNLKRQWIPDQK